MSETSETKIPKCLESRYSGKLLKIIGVDNIKKQLSTDYQLLLLTSYGFIAGDLSPIQTQEEITNQLKESNSVQLDISFCQDAYYKFFNELESEEKEINITDNSSFINMINVKVYKDNLKEFVMGTKCKYSIQSFLFYSSSLSSFLLGTSCPASSK